MEQCLSPRGALSCCSGAFDHMIFISRLLVGSLKNVHFFAHDFNVVELWNSS